MAVTPRGATNVPVPVFAATAPGGWGPVQELRGVSGVRLVPTPRHAAVLLVAGAVADEHGEALRRVHDQVPHPRTTVAWRRHGAARQIPSSHEVDGGLDAVVPALLDAFAELLSTPDRTTPDLLPDEDPNDWRGVGPFGQGGEGMMGGTPYGRPMAMTGDDRDGLALDRLHLRLGPFLDAFPAGLVLDVTLQGEVLQDATPHLAADPDPAAAGEASWPTDPSLAAARHGLRWLAHALHVAGLDALAARAAALAVRTTDAADLHAMRRGTNALGRQVARSGLLHALRGVGRDASAGDAATRWRGRMDAIAAALRGEPAAVTAPTRCDDPAGLLARILPGMTVADAVATIVSLDLVGAPVPA